MAVQTAVNGAVAGKNGAAPTLTADQVTAMMDELEAARAENASLKARGTRQGVRWAPGEGKGGISAFVNGRTRPANLYVEEWELLFSDEEIIRARAYFADVRSGKVRDSEGKMLKQSKSDIYVPTQKALDSDRRQAAIKAGTPVPATTAPTPSVAAVSGQSALSDILKGLTAEQLEALTLKLAE